MCVVCKDLGENWRNLNFIVKNVWLIYAGIIDDVVCEIDELKIVGTRYKVDESVWMSMVKNITAKKI